MSEQAKTELVSFGQETERKLKSKLPPEVVSERTERGITLSYVEAHYVIRQLNTIFGPGGWNHEFGYEQIEACSREDEGKRGYRAGYIAKARLTVPVVSPMLGVQSVVVREGVGTGSGYGPSLSIAVEGAIKEAESDALKRAAYKLGDPLGLALYDKQKRNVGFGESGKKGVGGGSITELIQKAESMRSLTMLWSELTADQKTANRDAFAARKAELG